MKFNLLSAVMTEIEASFTREEINAFPDFEAFWAEIDVINAYEDEWEAWKKKGIKETYKQIFKELRA